LPSIRKIIKVSIPRETKRAVVCTAIKQLRTLEFYYHGGYRTVEPFALGVVIKKGDIDNESLACWQTEGFSDFHETTGWKLYRLSEMEDLEILQVKFTGERPNYDPDAIEMDKVICCVRLKPSPVTATGPEVKQQTVIIYLNHNEVMSRFRYAHPMPIPELHTAIWPDPLMVRPFSKRIRSTIWNVAPVLETNYIVSQMASTI
jgi:hypothetical protein